MSDPKPERMRPQGAQTFKVTEDGKIYDVRPIPVTFARSQIAMAVQDQAFVRRIMDALNGLSPEERKFRRWEIWCGARARKARRGWR